MEIVCILQEVGVDINKIVIFYFDCIVFDFVKLLELVFIGVYLEYDMFGIELFYYVFNLVVDMMSDVQRIQNIKFLILEGYDDKVVIVYDVYICY